MQLLCGAAAVLAAVAGPGAMPRADATGRLINGAGSSYVALAMQQWVTDGKAQGLKVNYTPTGSPDGVQRYDGNQVDFAGTEAEFSSFGTTSVPRGYQYIPDVAGAIAIMYNLYDQSGHKVDYLHLSQQTIARIFMGDITSWSDPAISAENAGFKFPNQPINVVFRAGQSGTTGLFYDFVKHADPALFAKWAARVQAPTNVRIIEMPPNFAPKTQGLASSDQIAQFLASDAGKWSISYDEFGFAKTYGATSAWVQNASNKWVLPYAQNISAALESAKLRPDLSQDLTGVYSSGNPLAYPISAYSYIVTQCAPSGDRATCKGKYPDQGATDTLTPWLEYIACQGQVQMAQIGYSPLPTNLSQEIVNAVGRLNGTAPPLQLSAGNCSNPRFRGSLGAGAFSPPDPYLKLPGGVAAATHGAATPTGGTGGTGGTGPATGGATTGGGATTTTPAGAAAVASSAVKGGAAASGATGKAAAVLDKTAADGAGRAGAEVSAGGGSTDWRAPQPTAYHGGDSGGLPAGPALALLASLLVPTLFIAGRRRWARR